MLPEDSSDQPLASPSVEALVQEAMGWAFVNLGMTAAPPHHREGLNF